MPEDALGHARTCRQTEPKTQTFAPHPPSFFFITVKGIISAVDHDVEILGVIFVHITFFGGSQFGVCLYEIIHAATSL